MGINWNQWIQDILFHLLPSKASAGATDLLFLYDATTSTYKKITYNDLLNGLTGALTPRGTWDATANTPALASGVGTEGYMYIVNVVNAAAPALDGITVFDVDDVVFFANGTWHKVVSNVKVASVNGRTGVVTGVIDYLDPVHQIWGPSFEDNITLGAGNLDQATGYVLNKEFNFITSAGGASDRAAVLNLPIGGAMQVRNLTPDNQYLYPPVGCRIDAWGIDDAISMAAMGGLYRFIRTSATQIRTR